MSEEKTISDLEVAAKAWSKSGMAGVSRDSFIAGARWLAQQLVDRTDPTGWLEISISEIRQLSDES